MRYDENKKFQPVWSCELVWFDGISSIDGILHMVRCIPYTIIDGKPFIMAPKNDIVYKHDRKRIAINDMPQYSVKKAETYFALK